MYVFFLENQVSFTFINKCNDLLGICDLKSGFIYVTPFVLKDKILIYTFNLTNCLKVLCPAEQSSGAYTNTMFYSSQILKYNKVK